MILLTFLRFLQFVITQIIFAISQPAKFIKPVAKVGVPLALLSFGSYQNADAQSIRGPPVRLGRGDFVVLGEHERPMPLKVAKTPYNYSVTDIMRYDVDVLSTEHVKSGKQCLILYPNDRIWNVGDTINVDYMVHSDRSNKWTDNEIVNRTVKIPMSRAANPENIDFYDAVIYELNDVRHNFDAGSSASKED